VVEDASLLHGWASWETIKSIAPNGGKQIEFVLVDRNNPNRRVVAVHASEVKPDDRCDSCHDVPCYHSPVLLLALWCIARG
jgi:hypothetical protein